MPEFIGYSDVSRIYKGPLSCVYKARENSTQETRALKLLRLSKSQIEFNYTATISSPNVVRVFNHSPHQGEVEQEVSYNFRGNKLGFFSMEFLDGPDLKDIIMKGGLPAPAAVNFMLTVAKALLPLWREGKIHADIKPRNFLSIPNRGPVIIDFGIGSEY